jgi:hypothetical protein
MFVKTLKTLATLIIVTLCVAACAPAAARPPMQLQGSVRDMIGAAVATCPTITTLGYNYMSIEATGDGFVACRASTTTGVAILGLFGGIVSPDLKLNVAFSEVSGNVVRVDISSVPRNTGIEDQLEQALLARFRAL